MLDYCSWILSVFVCLKISFSFKRFYSFIWGGDRERAREGKTKRERRSESQADSPLNAEPKAGLELMTPRPWPEPKLRVRCSTKWSIQATAFRRTKCFPLHQKKACIYHPKPREPERTGILFQCNNPRTRLSANVTFLTIMTGLSWQCARRPPLHGVHGEWPQETEWNSRHQEGSGHRVSWNPQTLNLGKNFNLLVHHLCLNRESRSREVWQLSQTGHKARSRMQFTRFFNPLSCLGCLVFCPPQGTPRGQRSLLRLQHSPGLAFMT